MSNQLSRHGKIAQWGNGAAIRISAASLENARFSVDDLVDVISRENEIIIRPRRPHVSMSDLLARFDPTRHRHDLAFDTGPEGTETA